MIERPSIQKQLLDLLDDKAAVLLTGLRRVGKTTLMKHMIQHLLKEGVPASSLFYISLDDYQLKDETILDILEKYRAIQKLTHDQKVYVFLDEVTYQKDFRWQIKNIYDLQNVKVFASSSSALALKDERGWLTGRERIVEVSPLDFSEYLMFKKIDIKLADQYLLDQYFEDFMPTGGMPEYVLRGDREYLTSLVDGIINKDIIAYHQLRSPHTVKDFFSLLMERAGKQLSLNKVANILGIAVDTAKRYLQMFEESYLIYIVPRHGKTNETLLSPKKVYAADLGIRHLFTGFRDKGAIFENYVYLKIKNKRPRYVYQEGLEIDFLIEGKTLIEVKYKRKLEGRQKMLFETFPAKAKVIVRGFKDIQKLSHEN